MRIRIVGNRPPIPDNKLNRDFFAIVKGIADLLEIKVEPVHRRISSDICHVPENVPALGGFGPIAVLGETADDYILRDSLLDRSALLALTIHNSTR